MAAAAQPKPDTQISDPWARVEGLPCLLSIEIPVPRFKVADLVNLQSGQVIDTWWTVGDDVPLRVNGELIAWSEFEIMNSHIAVRLTELA